MRGIAAVAAAAFAVFAAGAPARADDMMLNDTSPPPYEAYAWTFAGLALLALGYGVYAYGQSQDELDEADKNYDRYRAADTESDALAYRDRTEEHRKDARDFETRANVAAALTVVFALTAYYSFNPGTGPELSLSATLDGPVFIWRF
jgi:hypothetical protein